METINSLPFIEPNQPSLRRFNTQNIVFRGKQIKLMSNPIFRCNYFLACYNSPHNQINGISLKRLPKNRFYYKVYPLLGLKYFLIHLLLDFVPYLNILWSILLITMWIIYEKASVVYNTNSKRLDSPLKRMIYDPDLCKRFKCMNKFLEVPSSFLLESNEENLANRVTVMIYNDSFRKMYSQFPCYRYLHMLHMLFSIFIMVLSYCWLYGALGINNFVIKPQ